MTGSQKLKDIIGVSVPAPSEPPRPYLMRVLRGNDRQAILKAAGKRKELSWRGRCLHAFQDLPVDIKKQRANFADIKKKVQGPDLRYGLFYPARLTVTIEGNKHIYNNPTDAANDLRSRLPTIFHQRPL